MSQVGFYLDEDTINAALVKALRNANLINLTSAVTHPSQNGTIFMD